MTDFRDHPFVQVAPLDEAELALIRAALRSSAVVVVPEGARFVFIGPEDAALERLAARRRFWRGVR
ncbi:MAG: hypothetical protein M3547_05365 [Acidobacteriota bacterium]|nr:hypothetical protein [Acidobacteriota bacterium]